MPEDLRQAAGGIVQVDQVLAAVRRQYRIILFFGLLGAIIGTGYALTAVPWYSASTLLLIDGRKGSDPDPTASIAELQFDTGAIDSQVEVLKSERIVTAVIAKAGLADDPSFQRATGSLFGTMIGAVRQALDVRRWFGSEAQSDAEARFAKERQLISTLAGNLTVKRVARTYVLSIEFSWPEASRAAEISRAFADAYLDDQLESKFDATRRATEWLFARIQELKTRALETDMAVQRFKSDNGLVKSGASGQLVGEQQLGELNSQLVIARGDTARAEARYQRIKSIIDSGQADAAVSEALGNPVIIDLRNKYLKASKTEAELSARLGRSHIQVISLRAEMREYERLIFDELGRIAESYKSEQEISRSREKALEENLSSLVGVNAGNLTYFLGSIFFTMAGFTQLRLTGRWQKGGWSSPDLWDDWWAAAIQFLGTIAFNVSTLVAIIGTIDPGTFEHMGWRPDFVGSICFMVASVLAVRATTHRESLWDPEARNWWNTWLNMIGAIAFMVSAVFAWIDPSTGAPLDTDWVNLGTFVGAICFLSAALLLKPEADRS